MSRPPKGPRLFPRRPKGRTPYWAILDTGGFERSTGHCLTKRKEAEAELARYIAGKHKTTVGGHTPKLVLVCDVLDSYLTSKTPTTGADQRAVKSFTDLTYFIERLAEWWDGKSLSDVKKSSCGDYVRWRTKQVHRRATKTSSPKLVSPSTARRELEVLRAAVNDYHAEFTLEAVPVVSLPERSESRIRWLSRSKLRDAFSRASAGAGTWKPGVLAGSGISGSPPQGLSRRWTFPACRKVSASKFVAVADTSRGL